MSADEHLNPQQFFVGHMRVSDLHPSEDDVHFDPDVQSALTRDISERGITEPIEVHASRGMLTRIYNGHHRYQAARDLGMKTVPVKLNTREGMPGKLVDGREISSDEYYHRNSRDGGRR
jgi:hypothetical protein